MFDQRQIDKIIAKLSEKWRMYEHLFLNHMSLNILRTESTNLDDAARKLRNSSLLGTKFVMSAATARAGGEQAGYGGIILKALDRCSTEAGGFERLVKEEDAPQKVYSEFRKICGERSKKPNDKINKGLILEFLEKVKGHSTGNLFVWLEESIRSKGIESAYLELLRIHGINKKITSFILRDIVWLLDWEKSIAPKDLMYIQPVDTWLKQISFELWKDLHGKVDELIIAKRIADRCSELGISSIHFNQGAWYFGSSEVKDGKLIGKYLNNLVGMC